MEFNEKEFKKIVRKANYKRTGIGIVFSLLLLLIITGGITFAVLTHYNYIDLGNKENPKVKGLPDASIRNLDGTEGYLGLLFNQSGGFEMNSTSEKMEVYLDYYEQGELKKHESVLTVLPQENVKNLNGSLYWGISQENKKLSISFNSKSGFGLSNDNFDMSFIDLEGWMSAGSPEQGIKKFKNENKQLLYKFVYNENHEMSSYSDTSEEFKMERIKENDKLILLYVEFK